MESFRHFLDEGALPLDKVMTKRGTKEVVVVQGRFQPPTLGHLKAIEQAYKKFKKPVAIVLVKGGKSKIPFDEKIQKKVFKAMLGSIPHIFVDEDSGFIGNFIDKLRKDNKEPIAIFTGSDRVKSYEAQIDRYVEKLNLNIKVHEIVRGDEDVSATKVRNALKDDDFEAFKKLTHKNVHKMFKELQAKL
jgi:cytidyltransferase-like protein